MIVDAAGELPPVKNLKKFTKMGADIVLFGIITRVYVKFDEEVLGLTKKDIAKELYEGDPRIAVTVEKNYLTFNPHMVVEGEEDLVIERIKDIIKKVDK